MKKISLLLLMLILQNQLYSQIPAFAGAEGFGSQTTHARGGRVIEVTNLLDEGNGSFRAACEALGARFVIFKVGGVIQLKKPVIVTNPNIYIAGQTAPGGGICLSGAALDIRTHDVVVRYLRSRFRKKNDPTLNEEFYDALDIGRTSTSADQSGIYNVVFDHLSASWGIDECMTVWAFKSHDITIQWCIISEGLRSAGHSKGNHSRGLLIGDETRDISIHHNLIAHHSYRFPEINRGTRVADVVNNVMYNWSHPFAASLNMGYTSVWETKFNFVNNFLKKGPNHVANSYEFRFGVWTSNPPPAGEWQLYVKGNLGPHRPDQSYDEWSLIDPSYNSKAQFQSNVRFPAAPITTQDAPTAMDLVLKCAGATLPKRDDVDTRIVNEVRTGTGKIIDDPSEVGGFPTYANGTPYIDTDHDGMPDAWETSRGLNPNNPADGSKTSPSSYTNVEDYLNSLTNCPEIITEISRNTLNEYQSQKHFFLYPVPSGTELFVNGDIPKNASYEILSIDGKLLQSDVIDNSSIPILNLASGIYFIKVKTDVGESVQRYVKE